jgi:hypothetical protein
MRCRAFHGSVNRFAQFEATPRRRATVAPTAGLGTFCVEDPRIAAHFTLRPHVLAAGYAHPLGSRILTDDPWALDSDPFLPGAGVAQVHLHLVAPVLLSVNTWLALMADLDRVPQRVTDLRDIWQSRGHDGVRIEAWDGNPLADGERLPSVETDAVTWVAFAPQALTIERWLDPADAWELIGSVPFECGSLTRTSENLEAMSLPPKTSPR